MKTCFWELGKEAKKLLELVFKNMQFAWKTFIDTVSVSTPFSFPIYMPWKLQELQSNQDKLASWMLKNVCCHIYQTVHSSYKLNWQICKVLSHFLRIYYFCSNHSESIRALGPETNQSLYNAEVKRKGIV